ncbi:MAG: hypothetical protein FWH43_05065 [Endomicrobia bacterium]|nr:hypothetical protein [Endomicrobiia bacterium]
MRKLFCSLLILSVCSAVSYSEFFYLKSGKVVNGKIIAESNDSVTVSVSGTGAKRKIMLYEIEEITKTPKPLPEVSQAKSDTGASDAEDAKTQFTSDFKQGNSEGDTYIKDNKSGVLVFNVQETVIEKPKAVSASQTAAEDEDFDAALFLLGKSASNNSTAASAPVNQKKDDAFAAADEDDEFDAALLLLSSEETARNSFENPPETKKQQKNDDYYDADKFLLDDNSYDAHDAKQESYAAYSEKPDSETFLAFAFDLKGVNIFSGKVKESGVSMKGDKTENSDYGISLSAEQYGYVSRFAAVGLGIGFQFKRCLEESPGRFGFLPLYGAFKMRFISEDDYHFYIVAHLGYNFLLANLDYLGRSEASGGLYYAGGLGASYNRYVLQVLYSVNNGSMKYSNSYAGDKVDRDVSYSKVGFYVGYLL